MIQKNMGLVVSFNIRHQLTFDCLLLHAHTQTPVEVIQETLPEYKSKFAHETRPKLPQKEISSCKHSDLFGKLAVGLRERNIISLHKNWLKDPWCARYAIRE